MAVDSQVSAIVSNNNPSTVVLARVQSSQQTGNVAVNNTSIAIDLSDANSNQTLGNAAINNTSNAKTNNAATSNAKANNTTTSSTLKKVVDNLNSLSDNLNIGTKFEAFEKMKGVYYIRTYNKQTNETISEFPPTKYLDMIANFINGTGNLVDRKV